MKVQIILLSAIFSMLTLPALADNDACASTDALAKDVCAAKQGFLRAHQLPAAGAQMPASVYGGSKQGNVAAEANGADNAGMSSSQQNTSAPAPVSTAPKNIYR